MKPRILYVCHNHPSVRPGGAEVYGAELYAGVRDAGDFEPVLLSRAGPPWSPATRRDAGTLLRPIGDDPLAYFLQTDDYHPLYDLTFGSYLGSKGVLSKHFRSFLEAVRPDLVHFQHSLFFGYDAVRVVRDTLPEAPIVYTLHEFFPICRNFGQLLRTTDGSICTEESPSRCHECFPEISAQTFFLRKRFIQSHLALVDRFIAPSRYLRDRYVEWGLPPEKIVVEANGRTLAAPPPSAAREPANRFAFFGQLSHHKGVDVLLEALSILRREGESGARGWIFGTNLDIQPREFQQRFRELLDETADHVTFAGAYEPAELGRLMAEIDWVVVPSRWPENSPLVIQEAFHHHRPVICSGVGGMAERVADGVDGLHFRVGDSSSLAGVLRRALGTPGLYAKLQAGIRPVYSMEEHVAALTRIYGELLGTRRPVPLRAAAG